MQLCAFASFFAKQTTEWILGSEIARLHDEIKQANADHVLLCDRVDRRSSL